MASRRALVSSALRASSAIRPARPVFALACRAAAAAQRIQPFVPRASVAPRIVRWYSTEDTVPGSKIWEFAEIKKQVEEGKGGKVVIVDVREPRELFQTGKIPGAINIPITSAVQSFHIPEEDFEEMYGFERPPKDAELLFYCKAGVRARAAAGLAKHAGWEKVGEYPGSWLDWEAQNGPVEKVENKEDGYLDNSQ